MSCNANINLTNSFGSLVIDEPLDPAETITKIVKKNTKTKKRQKKKSKSYPIVIFERTETTEKQNVDKTTKKVNKARKTKSVKPAIKQVDPNPVSPIQTKSYNEFKAEIEAKRRLRKPPSYNLRKPGEGEDQTQWSKLVPLNKSKKLGEVQLWSPERKGAGRGSDTRILIPVRYMSGRTVHRKAAVAREAIDAFEAALSSLDQPPPQCEDEKEFPSLP